MCCIVFFMARCVVTWRLCVIFRSELWNIITYTLLKTRRSEVINSSREEKLISFLSPFDLQFINDDAKVSQSAIEAISRRKKNLVCFWQHTETFFGIVAKQSSLVRFLPNERTKIISSINLWKAGSEVEQVRVVGN